MLCPYITNMEAAGYVVKVFSDHGKLLPVYLRDSLSLLTKSSYQM